MSAALHPPPRPAADLAALLGAVLTVEREARRMPDAAALAFLAVNDTRQVVAYDMAVLLQGGGRRWRATALSGLVAPDPAAPLPRCLARAAALLAQPGAARAVGPADLPDSLRGEWMELAPPSARWPPGRAAACRQAARRAAAAAARAPFTSAELDLVSRLAETYGSAAAALAARPPRLRRAGLRGAVAALALAGLAGLALLPVPLSVLAPAEIVARTPLPVAAPIEGVVRQVLVQPNEAVAEGQTLFRLDDVTLRNRRDIALKARAVAEAELARAQQRGFSDADSRNQIRLLRLQAEEKGLEAKLAEELLERVEVRAARAGIVLLNDPQAWIGRPVATGERVMSLADPAELALRAWLPAAEAVPLPEAARVRFFPDADPLSPLAARLERVNYEAEATPGGGLAFQARAGLEAGAAARLGAQGVARLEGGTVTLGYYLLRRPLAAARRALGV
ncbi:efflux RND transporter periplasmic adaptor subunit [Pseudoroseomonas cervicalis]|uniref:efflux RND transporter periplasmic adaptor subunit n=1 Tax=Teichococcus cervicalis TaxID=204525 RepID=UPI0022F1D355|nr:HlyD family secretion protein [Pseudoroseomonas cervicalis]WBV42789.1 HlyD family efflux transporter periplasmic adaptor subunit [Pseudoroseomonas cervicalis]